MGAQKLPAALCSTAYRSLRNKVGLERVAACLGAGDPPRGWAEAFKRLAILSSHAETPLFVESSHKLSATLGVFGPREKRSEPVRPQLGAGTLAFSV